MSPQDTVSLQAPAKVNLYLKITGRRADGYHLLATLMQKISLYDHIDLELRDSGITLACPENDLPEDESNLAFQAAWVFLERLREKGHKSNSGVAITLRKKIPVAAGLGGGSSDAATVLKGLNQLFSYPFEVHELLEMGLSLGADVPFFVIEHPAAWATGIGERLQQAEPLSGYGILVVNPGYSVSTRWVYENFALTVGENKNNLKYLQKPETGEEWQSKLDSRGFRPDEMVNDLEMVTLSHYPGIEKLKSHLVRCGAEAALMSGSGPTVFGLFVKDELERASACEEKLKGEYMNVFMVDPLQE